MLQDVLALVLGAFKDGHSPTTPPFSLISPGGTNLKRRTLGAQETRNVSIAALGLSPPAATLLVQWKGGRPGEDAVRPKATAAWVREELLLRRRPPGRGGEEDKEGDGDEL